MNGAVQESALELCAISKELGGKRVVDGVSLAVRAGEFFSLLGPSGCGKTTTLRLVAGFEAPTSGEIRIGGLDVAGLPPYRRDVNLVFQNYALFPHLTVRKNVSFPLEMQRLAGAEIERRTAEALDQVRMTGFEDRFPHQLSGGQQQRVAVARAAVGRPSLLLLDEPLGALDLRLRREMQVELKGIQRRLGIAFVYVTHDQEEALAMSDRLAVMRDGKIEQIGTPEEVYEAPATPFAAEFLGEANLFEGRVTLVDGGAARVEAAGTTMAATNGSGAAVGQAVTLMIRPERVTVGPRGTAAAGDGEANRLAGTVEESTFLGAATRYVVRLDGGGKLVSNGKPGAAANGQAVVAGFEAKDARVLT